MNVKMCSIHLNKKKGLPKEQKVSWRGLKDLFPFWFCLNQVCISLLKQKLSLSYLWPGAVASWLSHSHIYFCLSPICFLLSNEDMICKLPVWSFQTYVLPSLAWPMNFPVWPGPSFRTHLSLCSLSISTPATLTVLVFLQDFCSCWFLYQ